MAVFACGLEMSSTETKGTVLIRTGEELMSYNKVGAATSVSCCACVHVVVSMSRAELACLQSCRVVLDGAVESCVHQRGGSFLSFSRI